MATPSNRTSRAKILALALVWALFCSWSPSPVSADNRSNVVAEVSARKFTARDLGLQDPLGILSAETDLFEAKKLRLDRLVATWIVEQEAKAVSMGKEEFLDKKVYQGKADPTEKDVADFLKERGKDP